MRFPAHRGSTGATAHLPQTDGYTLTIADRWMLELRWDTGLERKLRAIRDAWPARGQAGMDLLLGRLTGLLARWRSAELLQTRINVSFPPARCGASAMPCWPHCRITRGVQFAHRRRHRQAPIDTLASATSRRAGIPVPGKGGGLQLHHPRQARCSLCNGFTDGGIYNLGITMYVR